MATNEQRRIADISGELREAADAGERDRAAALTEELAAALAAGEPLDDVTDREPVRRVRE